MFFFPQKLHIVPLLFLKSKQCVYRGLTDFSFMFKTVVSINQSPFLSMNAHIILLSQAQHFVKIDNYSTIHFSFSSSCCANRKTKRVVHVLMVLLLSLFFDFVVAEEDKYYSISYFSIDVVVFLSNPSILVFLW
mmetsp:Transcript_23902/g.35694  ORF Transcript_23902/g.35694 Transcript_23902/m.35694 type:complete len:134 (-) Transcript_23902:1129-1530(-)